MEGEKGRAIKESQGLIHALQKTINMLNCCYYSYNYSIIVIIRKVLDELMRNIGHNIKLNIKLINFHKEYKFQKYPINIFVVKS